MIVGYFLISAAFGVAIHIDLMIAVVVGKDHVLPFAGTKLTGMVGVDIFLAFGSCYFVIVTGFLKGFDKYRGLGGEANRRLCI